MEGSHSPCLLDCRIHSLDDFRNGCALTPIESPRIAVLVERRRYQAAGFTPKNPAATSNSDSATWNAGGCTSGRAAVRRVVCGGRCLPESREPALYVLLLLCAGHGQIVAQLVFSLIHSATPEQDLRQEQPGIWKLVLRLSQQFYGLKGVAFLRG